MRDSGTPYDDSFFRAQFEGSDHSAQVIAPIVMSLFPQIRSVIDVGCGTGIWLKNFQRLGVARVLGVDSASPGTNLLQIDPKDYLLANLEEPLPIAERFDLCLCLEVAEHLPENTAESLVKQLCRHSDVVLFSAAIPGQGGTHHINERWQSYWAALFEAEGYELSDSVRNSIWYNARVDWWYAQNIIVFVNASREDLGNRHTGSSVPLDVVHPRCFEECRRMLEELRGRHNALRKAAGLIKSKTKSGDEFGLMAENDNGRFRKRGQDLNAAIRSSKMAEAGLDKLRRSGGFRIVSLAVPSLGRDVDSISSHLKEIRQVHEQMRGKRPHNRKNGKQ